MSFYKKSIKVLSDLKKSKPNCNLGKHIATAIDNLEVNDLWGISDKELYEKLNNYQIQLDMDVSHHEDDIENILIDGKNLYNLGFDEYEN
jgi:hypothetical protein